MSAASSAASKRAWADPVVRAKMGFLSPEERSHVVAAIKSGARYIDMRPEVRA